MSKPCKLAQLTVRIPESAKKAIKLKAVSEGRTISSVVMTMLRLAGLVK